MNTIVLPASPLHLGKISVPVRKSVAELTTYTDPEDESNTETYTNLSDTPEQIVLKHGAVVSITRNEIKTNFSTGTDVIGLILSPGDMVEFQNSEVSNSGFVIPLW